jgi:hypothetical protein
MDKLKPNKYGVTWERFSRSTFISAFAQMCYDADPDGVLTDKALALVVIQFWLQGQYESQFVPITHEFLDLCDAEIPADYRELGATIEPLPKGSFQGIVDVAQKADTINYKVTDEDNSVDPRDVLPVTIKGEMTCDDGIHQVVNQNDSHVVLVKDECENSGDAGKFEHDLNKASQFVTYELNMSQHRDDIIEFCGVPISADKCEVSDIVKKVEPDNYKEIPQLVTYQFGGCSGCDHTAQFCKEVDGYEEAHSRSPSISTFDGGSVTSEDLITEPKFKYCDQTVVGTLGIGKMGFVEIGLGKSFRDSVFRSVDQWLSKGVT